MAETIKLPEDIAFSREVPHLLGFTRHSPTLTAAALRWCVNIENQRGNDTAAAALAPLLADIVKELTPEQVLIYEKTIIPASYR